MTWVAVGMSALGVVQGDKNERKANDEKAYKAELLKYAPYNTAAASIASQGVVEKPGSLEMGLGGASNGIATSETLKKAGYFGGESPEAKAMAQMQPGIKADGTPMTAEELQRYTNYAGRITLNA